MLPDRFEAAARRFKAFFDELNEAFFEREDVLAQIALALLSREHVLMTGPPGTAKSNIASAVLRRVIDETTGEPSVFSRQFTESTVQTDLVGPINFKTLMESGRTEHFTDEGMLGAVHSFLDEVFDGRDMLLRSTLNVLQERELKQGAKVTRGRIECALMTTNRYLAEVLAGSRETLLAFVDRLAFVSFVPRGFSGQSSMQNVLKTQLKTVRGAQLHAVLTIQDLDALQAATDDVYVPDAICEALVKLIDAYDEETAAAERADTAFIATRYLSTRAVVRLGRIMRAVAVYNRVFDDPERPLEVIGPDLAGVRYGLLLCGPPPDSIKALLAKETDPRERRQLAIVRTEREIFDRVLAKMPRIPRAPRPKPAKIEELRSIADDAPNRKLEDLASATRKLAVAADVRDTAADDAAKLLEKVVRELSERALKRGLLLGITGDGEVERVVSELADLAQQIEESSGQGRPMARWLRGRAATLVDEAAHMLVPGSAASIKALEGKSTGLDGVRELCDRCLASLETMKRLREGLRAAGAEILDTDGSERRWKAALEHSENDLATILDTGFRADVQGVMSLSSDMSTILQALAEPFSLIGTYAKRLSGLGIASQLETLVIAPRIKPLVAAAFARIRAVDEKQLMADVESLLAILERSGLRHVLEPRDLLVLAASALVRTKSRAPFETATYDRSAYRKLRDGHKVPSAFTLLELALRLSPAPAQTVPQDLVAHVQALANALPEDVADAVAQLDTTRLEQTITFFERWWGELESADLDSIAKSGFFQIAQEERALFRFTLEARLVADVFPSSVEKTDGIRARIELLQRRSDDHTRSLLRKKSDEEWAQLLHTMS